jgi:hypothetical protein
MRPFEFGANLRLLNRYYDSVSSFTFGLIECPVSGLQNRFSIIAMIRKGCNTRRDGEWTQGRATEINVKCPNASAQFFRPLLG